MSKFRGNRCIRELCELAEDRLRPYAASFTREPGSGHHRLRVELRDGREVVVAICGTPRSTDNARSILRQKLQRLVRDLGLET